MNRKVLLIKTINRTEEFRCRITAGKESEETLTEGNYFLQILGIGSGRIMFFWNRHICEK